MNGDELLARSQLGAAPAPGLRERVRERLQLELAGAAPLVPAAGAGSVPAAAVRAASGLGVWGGKALWGVLGLCAGFALGWGSRHEAPASAPGGRAALQEEAALQERAALQEQSPPVEAALRPAPSASPASSSEVAPTLAPELPPTVAEPSPALLRRATSKRPKPRATPSPSRQLGAAPSDPAAAQLPASDADRLREALAYLQRAHALLRAGDPNAALAQLTELERRVPSEPLQEEREVTLALALCDSGDPGRASRVARRLLERSPASVYARSLAESCVGRERVLAEMRERTSKPRE